MAEIIYSTDDFSNLDVLQSSVCCFGVFDGVHVGHRFLIRQTIDSALQHGVKSAVITFDIDPDELFKRKGFVKLMSNEKRIEALADSGVDLVVVLPFSREFAAQSPIEFLNSTFNSGVPVELHVGSNFRFGCKAAGTVSDLTAWGANHGMSVVGHDLETALGTVVSATRIRTLLEDGSNIGQANELLGRPYRMSGRVEQGRKEGRDMGFRTANVFVPINLRALAPGVFGAYAFVEGHRYKAAVSVGVSPMFADETQAYCEAHLLDFEGDIYGDVVDIDFIEWLRPMMKFSSVEELISTVMGNIDWVRNNL